MLASNRKIKVVAGFDLSQVCTEWAEVVVEVRTNGSCSDGYKGAETIGIAKTECNSLALYRGGLGDPFPFSMLVLSDDCDNIAKLLRELADSYEKSVENIK